VGRWVARWFPPSPVAILGLWSVFALAVQRWASWNDGLRELYASDMRFYEIIARAAPGFPKTHVLRAYAERFPVHWLVGELAHTTSVPLHTVYRVADLAIVASVVAVVHLALRTIGVGRREYALAIGALVASPYPVHYLLASPGMISDGLFELGLAVLMLGFVRESIGGVLLGLVLATLGRQTALPIAPAAALWAMLLPAWRDARRRYVATILLVPAAVYGVLHVAADSFVQPRPASFSGLTVWGYIVEPHQLAAHLGRTAVAVVVPVALIAAAWWRSRGPLPLGALLIAADVIVQPILLGPVSDGGNEPRLAGLAVPALVVVAGLVLRRVRLSRAETLLGVIAIGLAGLHPRYTDLGHYRAADWVALEALATLALLVVIGRTWPLRGRALSG
jgi:hypothetical protein